MSPEEAELDRIDKEIADYDDGPVLGDDDERDYYYRGLGTARPSTDPGAYGEGVFIRWR